jgi:hypothetical protein
MSFWSVFKYELGAHVKEKYGLKKYQWHRKRWFEISMKSECCPIRIYVWWNQARYGYNQTEKLI